LIFEISLDEKQKLKLLWPYSYSCKLSEAHYTSIKLELFQLMKIHPYGKANWHNFPGPSRQPVNQMDLLPLGMIILKITPKNYESHQICSIPSADSKGPS
jgi:hypothetical protein